VWSYTYALAVSIAFSFLLEIDPTYDQPGLQDNPPSIASSNVS
jgi:hypothetical protein